MKKLLFAIAGAAAFSAFAADPSAGANDIDVLGFENFDLTNPNVTGAVINRDDTGVEGTSKWSCSGDDASLVKTYGGDNAAAPSGISFPAPFEDAGDKYLALDTNGAELQRAIPAAGQAIGASGTYVDTLVQFTPSESAPSETDLTGAKLAIWLGVENNVTNLCVQGACYTLAEGQFNFTTPQKYTLSGTYEPGTWYRLTVKAVSSLLNGMEGQYLPGFVISIDGQTLTTAESAADAAAYSYLTSTIGEGAEAFTPVSGANKDLLDDKQFIPSLAVSAMDIAPTLTSVGFKGTGAIDDFVVTTVAPEFTPAATYPTYVGEDAALKSQYDTWKATNGADSESAYEKQFLLNVAPGTTVADDALVIESITENETSGWDIVVSTSVSGAALSANDATTYNGYLLVKAANDLAGLSTATPVAYTVTAVTGGKVSINVTAGKFMKVVLTTTAPTTPAGD